MATLINNNAQVVKGRNGVFPELAHGVEAATQTWKAGAFLKLVSGKLTQCITALNSGVEMVVGIAAANATGVTDADVPYYPVDDNTVISINKDISVNSGATRQVDIGSLGTLTLTGSLWSVKSEVAGHATTVAPTTMHVRVIGFDGRDAVGDILGRLLCIVQSYCTASGIMV